MDRPTYAARLFLFALLIVGSARSAGEVSAAPLGGTLSGKVTMRTIGAALPPTPLVVTLLFYNPGYFRINDEAVDFKETQTAPDGSFTFAGLDTAPSGVYRVVVRYKGVAYEPAPRDFTDPNGVAGKTNAVRFEMNAKTATIEIPIAEPVAGAYGNGFTVVSHSFVVNEIRPQFYSVVEAMQIRNDTDRTLFGSLKPDGTAGDGVPVVFTTPDMARDVGTQRTDLLATGDLTGQKLTLLTPIVPGITDITAAYTLQGGAVGVTLKRPLDYAAAKVQVLVSDTRQPIDSGMLLRPDPPIQAGPSTTFRPFTAENVTQGQEIQMLIGPSPPAATATPPRADDGNVLERIRSGISSPALLALAALCFVLMIVVLRLPTGNKQAARGTRQTVAKPAATATTTVTTDANHDDHTDIVTPVPAVAPVRRGRPHDAEMDEAEREIEAANTASGSPQPAASNQATDDADEATAPAAITPAKRGPASRRSRR